MTGPLDNATEGDEIGGDHARRVPVLLPYPFAGPFDYWAPAGMGLAPGDIVLVPLNRRQEVGVVWDAPGGTPVAAGKLKPVSGRVDAPAMGGALRRLIDWIAGYTLSAPGAVLAMALRVNALSAPPLQIGWQKKLGEQCLERAGACAGPLKAHPTQFFLCEGGNDGRKYGAADAGRDHAVVR